MRQLGGGWQCGWACVHMEVLPGSLTCPDAGSLWRCVRSCCWLNALCASAHSLATHRPTCSPHRPQYFGVDAGSKRSHSPPESHNSNSGSGDECDGSDNASSRSGSGSLEVSEAARQIASAMCAAQQLPGEPPQQVGGWRRAGALRGMGANLRV